MKNHGNLSDEALVELVTDKDQELFSELVNRYQAKLLRYAGRLLADEHQAADVVQTAFIKAFVNLRGFDTKKKFSSWLYRIVHNEAINLIKKEKNKISLDKNQWVNDLSDDEPEIEEKLVEKELKQQVRTSLKKLPLIYRSVLNLHYLEEKSYEEISDILKIPVGTVGTRVSRGKKIMRVIYRRGTK